MRFRLPLAAAAAFALLIVPPAWAQDPPAGEEEFVEAHEVTLDNVGEDLVVRGRIARTESNPVQGITIHFDRTHIDYPFRVFIPRQDLGDWEGTDPVKVYSRGRIIKITGEIEEQGENPYIRVTARSQIEIVPRTRRRRRRPPGADSGPDPAAAIRAAAAFRSLGARTGAAAGP